MSTDLNAVHTSVVLGEEDTNLKTLTSSVVLGEEDANLKAATISVVLIDQPFETQVANILLEVVSTTTVIGPDICLAGLPAQYFILPDPQLEGSANVVSATSEQGAFAGLSAAELDNAGHMYPVQSGNPALTAEDLDYQLVESGGIGSAEFVYKQADEAGTEFRGKDDPRRMWRFHVPFGASTSKQSNTCCYSKKFRRILVFAESTTGDGTIFCAYRAVEDSYLTWTEVSFTPVQEQESFGHELQAIELEDGAILLFVRTNNTASLQTDFDVYRSDDGGETWQIHSSQLLLRFTDGGLAGAWGSQYANAQFRVRRSGDHIRLVQIRSSDNLPQTLLSTDRGATWKHIPPSGIGSPFTTHGGSDDQYPFDFVATDNPGAGGFYLIAKGASSNLIEVWVTTSENVWDNLVFTHVTPATTEARSFCLVNDGAYVTELTFFTAGAADPADNWTMRRLRLNSGLNFAGTPDDWDQVDDIINSTGFRHVPIRAQMISTGDGLFVQFVGADQQSSYAEESASTIGGYMDVWTKSSVGQTGPGSPLTDSTLFDVYWAAWSGRPAPVGNSAVSDDTLWTESLAGTPGIISNARHFQLSSTGAGDGAKYQRNYNSELTGSGAVYLANGSTWGWICEIDINDGDILAASRFLHFRVVSSESLTVASNNIDIAIRMAYDEFSVYDENTSTALATVALDLTSRKEFRMFIIDRGASVICIVQTLDPVTGVLTSTGELTVTEQNDPVANFIELGISNAPAAPAGTNTIRFYEVWSAFGKDMLMDNPVNPTDLFGAVCKSTPQEVEQGIDVAWVGAGGLTGDSYSGTIQHTYAAENVLQPSPRIGWRSTGVATQAIIYDADPENGVGRFFHNAAAVFGITDGSVIIDYDDDVAFGSPVAGITLEPKVFTGISIVSVRGNALVFTASGPQLGEGREMICEFTSGGANGLRMLVTMHVGSNSVHHLVMGDETIDLATSGVATSNTFDLYETISAGKYPDGTIDGQRYMRVRFTDSDTHTDDHRLGSLVVGWFLDFDVPMDWAHTDNEQPNTTHYKSRGAIQWSYQEGPPQRTFTGRVVGDATQRWRDKFRDLFASLVQYELKPVAMVLDSEAPNTKRNVMLGRVSSGSQQDNAAYYRDADGVIRRAGDQSITFVEEV